MEGNLGGEAGSREVLLMNRLIYILEETLEETMKSHLFDLSKVNVDTRPYI